MLALYRSGRQAEALAAYHDTRRLLEEELGITPCPQLQLRHQQILNNDTALGRCQVSATA
jgi:DNA-binding SARP family transcriptional activator